MGTVIDFTFNLIHNSRRVVDSVVPVLLFQCYSRTVRDIMLHLYK
jgi:hypothetical protein